jgi:hypothetical protein
MAETQELHRAGLLKALGAKPHELQAWLKLEPLASRPTKERSATAYTTVDLLFLAVIKTLHSSGLSPKALKSFSASLYRAIQQPIEAGARDEIRLHHDGDGKWRVGSPSASVEAVQMLVALAPARRLVVEFTGAHLVSGQRELKLLTSIGVGARGAARRIAQ